MEAQVSVWDPFAARYIWKGGTLTDCIQTRVGWKGASSTAVFLNHRGGRLSDRATRAITTGLGEACGINDDPTDPFGPHVLLSAFPSGWSPRIRASPSVVTRSSSTASSALPGSVATQSECGILCHSEFGVPADRQPVRGLPLQAVTAYRDYRTARQSAGAVTRTKSVSDRGVICGYLALSRLSNLALPLTMHHWYCSAT